ncbi:MAG TPA: DUF2059 domain-containing protein [Candidatus Limnocylindrales bacterium]|nr:DUF2059 domain-containing protein [Candidatus Limnocylindrales bacterium]
MKYKLPVIALVFLVAGWAIARSSTISALASHQATGQSSSHPPSQLETVGETPAPAQTGAVDPAKEKAIRQLMDLNGSAKLGENMTEVLTSQVKSAVGRNITGDRLQKFMSDFSEKISARSPAGEVNNAEVPIYAQHFSMEDLQGMIQFYQSPAGQKMAKLLPQVLQESQQAGATIERNVAITTLREMSNDYPEIKPMLPEEQRPSLNPGSQPKPQSPIPPQNPR